jgi:protein TonB
MSAVMHNDQDRALHYALLLSIALHGALLFGINSFHEPASQPAAPGPIVARLAQPAAPAAPAPAPQPEVIKPQAPEKPPPAAKHAPAGKPRPLAKPAAKAPATLPQPSGAPPQAEAQTSPSDAPRAAAPAAPSGPAIARVEPTPGPAAPSAETFDAGSLAQYRLQLISAARKYKRYPRVAMDNNWEGDVVVRMVIGANGMISALSIQSSSGYDVLDQQALEMFKRAKPLVQIPPALRGRQFTIELRAIYSLKDQESS